MGVPDHIGPRRRSVAMKEAATLMIAGVLAAVLVMPMALYASAGKPDSDPEITRAAPIQD